MNKLLHELVTRTADEPKIDASKLLNNRTPPANPRLKKFRYNDKTWKTAPELSETFLKLAQDAPGRGDFVELGTLRLCFTLDYVALLNRSVAHMAAKR
ncbi:hypothetical protein AAVH_23115 [Aphelenchoides avenae]|nr:hypothetical protein AAVH_23115 [Aphelenchus avenae]